MNFTRDVVEAAPADRVALVGRTRDGGRREHTFGALADRSARLAGTFGRVGVGRGDVVLTLVGARVEWVEAMLACFRTGAIVLPCNEQLTASDLRTRLEVARPSLVLADERNRTVVEAARPDCPVLLVPDAGLYDAPPAAAAELEPTDPCLVTFTSGTSGPPKAVLHGQRYLPGQRVQAEHWLDARAGDLVWCTASPGWSKSARNAFIAPWLRGATALLHDARFDPAERVEVAAEEGVHVWCMAPTEYRLVAKRAQPRRLPTLRSLVAAGEALDPDTLRVWREATGLDVRDGYGQTETGQVTGNPVDRPARPGSMGLPLPGVRVEIVDGELCVDPTTVPTFCVGYLGGEQVPTGTMWHTGDRVHRDDDGYLYFKGRADDVINSAGYRIGPFEVESVLSRHPAVAECAVVGAPDEERGTVVRAVVVTREGWAHSDALRRELQDFVKARTAPYKYPRQVDFADDLPRTTTGKVRRAALRAED